MYRLFVALCPPAAIRDLLADTMEGVPAARWQDDEQLHLTLRFIGEVDATRAEDVAVALAGIGAPAIEARLAGAGHFGSDGPTSLWAGIAPRAPLAALQAKVNRALATAGIAPDGRAFLPHVTVARLSRSTGRQPAVRAWLAAHATLTSPPFRLDEVTLFESRLGRAGAHYAPVARWPLSRR